MILNHTIEALLDRRSIRSYRPEQISEEELSDILAVGRYAPSAVGGQRRHFTVIQNKKLMQDIVEATLEAGGSFREGHVPFFGAPTLVVLSAPEWGYSHEDTSCAIMNIMVAAHAYGLGSCFLGSVVPGLRHKDILPRLKLPDGYTPYSCVTLGYAAEHAPSPAPRKTDDTNYIR